LFALVRRPRVRRTTPAELLGQSMRIGRRVKLASTFRKAAVDPSAEEVTSVRDLYKLQTTLSRFISQALDSFDDV